jgi:hypothetical protein
VNGKNRSTVYSERPTWFGIEQAAVLKQRRKLERPVVECDSAEGSVDCFCASPVCMMHRTDAAKRNAATIDVVFDSE